MQYYLQVRPDTVSVRVEARGEGQPEPVLNSGTLFFLEHLERRKKLRCEISYEDISKKRHKLNNLIKR